MALAVEPGQAKIPNYRNAVKKEIPDLAVLLTKEQGKPLGDSQREIEHFLHGMNFYAGLASKIRGS